MKQVMTTISLMLIGIGTMAQKEIPVTAAKDDPANWSTWLLDSPQEITVQAPPSPTGTKTELQEVKRRLATLSAKEIAAIKYWDAGAPSYRWNQIGPALINQNQEILLRIPTAWMNIAIYDATILAWKEKERYKRKRPGSADPVIVTAVDAPLTYAYPCEHSVTAAAAATMLAYFFPDKADSILQLAHEAGQSRIDAGVQYPSDVEAGWKLGEQVAKAIVEKAKQDGSANKWDGVMNKDPKKWTGKYPAGITLSSFKPIVIQSAKQFRPPAPPDFEKDMQEMKQFKSNFKTASLAYYWANNGGFDFWSEVAAQKMFEYRIADDALVAARIYAVLHTAYHDAAIAIMDAKYAYWGIRPNQYDTTYKSLIPTPPFPGYPSGHAIGASTSATVLGYFFPADVKQFNQMAQGCADSRFYGGIHFRTDNETGLAMGKAIGNYVVNTWMKK